MFYYARSDTHFLLYIYDMLRNELLDPSAPQHPDGNPMDRVVQKSKDVSLQRYEHPGFDPKTGLGNRGWYNTLAKSSALLNGEQFSIYKAVWAWRDKFARREDESPGFIMTQQMILDIACIIPTDKKALWSLLGANARQLKDHLNDLFTVIQEAKKEGANGPTLMQFLRDGYGTPIGKAGPTVKANADARSIEELKSTHSQLWGGVPLSSAWDVSSNNVFAEGIVSIPLFAHMVEDMSIVEKAPAEAEKAPPPPSSKAEPVEEDRGFTLKSGTSRKRKANDGKEEEQQARDLDIEMEEVAEPASTDGNSAPASGSEEVRADQDEEANDPYKQAREEKKARKAAKRAAKLAAKKAQEEEEDEEEEVFDYSKAESVLRTSNRMEEENGGKSGKGKKGKPFDPYAFKSQNAPSGERQMNFERAGRSATFKK